ncbi:hypothetical protein [Pseudomonas sp.]|uniref:hypothetical protein n=1 Tax=Pseudomonas sp. TaxID=306 RepID=UPI002582D3AB|nr:hypothetical protein [Pseudomonas sp.]
MNEVIKQYARQPSTWRGLALLLAAFGVVVDPGLIEQIGVGVVGLIGLVELAKNEGK